MLREWFINDYDNSIFVGVKVELMSVERKPDNTLIINLDASPVSRNVFHIGCCLSVCFVNGFIASCKGTVVPDFVVDYTVNVLYKHYTEIRERALEAFKAPVNMDNILQDYLNKKRW